MKTISRTSWMAVLLVLTVSVISCKKDKQAALKQTRLKTYTYNNGTNSSLYTIDYNTAGKISTVQCFLNGSLYSTTNCVYKGGNLLDSIIKNPVTGSPTSYKISWTGNQLTKYNIINLSYTSNGLVDRKTYDDGEYFRNEYKDDSVILYHAPVSGSESIWGKCKLSSSIKNPFLIPGFEKEACITTLLFAHNNELNAPLPTIESALISYTGSISGVLTEYTFSGDFNGYPLSRAGNGQTETYTYEEF